MDNETLRYLGLVYRGRRIALGEDAIMLCKKQKIVMLLLAMNASENTKKKVLQIANTMQIPAIEAYSKEEFGHALGIASGVSTIGIKDRKIAEKIKSQMEKKVG